MPRDEDDRKLEVSLPHFFLNFQSRHVGHPNVEEETAGHSRIVFDEKVDRAGIHLRAPAFDVEHEGKGFAHVVFVVDDADEGVLRGRGHDWVP